MFIYSTLGGSGPATDEMTIQAPGNGRFRSVAFNAWLDAGNQCLLAAFLSLSRVIGTNPLTSGTQNTNIAAAIVVDQDTAGRQTSPQQLIVPVHVPVLATQVLWLTALVELCNDYRVIAIVDFEPM